MKRSFAQYCESPEARANTGTFRLTGLPYDILGLVVRWLDMESVRKLMFCLLVEHNIGDRILILRGMFDTSTLEKAQHETLGALQTLLSGRFPAIYMDCVVRHISDVTDENSHYTIDWIRNGGDKALENARDKMKRIRNVANNDYWPLLTFLSTEMCERCNDKLRTRTYWSNTRPLHLCADCHQHMEHSIVIHASVEQLLDGYAWLTATKLKAMCWVPNNIKATDFANASGIRLHSRHILDKDSATVADKEYYFLKDAMPYFRSLHDRKK